MGSFLLTTIGAITIGLFLAFLIQPGNGVSITGGEPQVLEAAIPLGERMMNIIPSNPIAALAEGDILAVIFFALLLGVGIMMSGKRAKPVADLMDSGSEVVLKITHLIMEVAPFGVFALIAAVAGTRGAGALLDVVPLALTILLGCFLHVIIVYGGIIRVVLGLPALRFFKDIVDAQLVAFSTSSSSATMPISIAVAEGNLGIKSPVASSVIPLGATVNMDGTAIYVGVVAVFTAQSFGIPLGLTDYALIALTTTIASIGTAAVPSASLFLLAGVLGVLGVTGEQTAIVVGFLLPFDRPLDMVRTTVNVTGNLAVCTAVAKWENEIDLDEFRRNPNI